MEEAGLLADIREHPEDVGLRRIYADWLEDHGELARAEFIRVQLDLAAMDDWDDRRPALVKREALLLREHRDRWLEGLPSKELEYTFHGGMVEAVSGQASQVLQDVAQFSGQAIIRRLKLKRDLPGRNPLPCEALALLNHIESLDLSSDNTPMEAWSMLLENCDFSRLRDLSFRLYTDPISVLGQIVKHSFSGRLANLKIWITSRELWSLTPLEAWPSDRFLHLFSLHTIRHVPEEVFHSLCDLPIFRRLRELEVCLLYGWDRILGLLQSAPFAPRLRGLVLISGDTLTAAEQWANLPFQELRHLYLGCSVDPGMFSRVAQAPWFAGLQSFELRCFGSQSGSEGLAVGGVPAPRLTRCVLPLPTDHAAILTLTKWGAWPSVRSLFLSGSYSVEQLRPFLEAAPLDNLRELVLANGTLYNAVELLARWSGLPRLWRLNLASTGIDDYGARVLLDALPPLVELDLRGNKLSADTGAAYLALEASGHIGTLHMDKY